MLLDGGKKACGRSTESLNISFEKLAEIYCLLRRSNKYKDVAFDLACLSIGKNSKKTLKIWRALD